MSNQVGGYDRLIRIQQANLIAVQSQRIAQLELELAAALERIRELESPRPSEAAKREAQA